MVSELKKGQRVKSKTEIENGTDIETECQIGIDRDPDDKSLRKVEIEVVIPKLIREKAKIDKCPKEVEDFGKCCVDNSLLMVVKCRKENQIMKDCLLRWYYDEGFKNYCTEEYLKERSEYRRTGKKKPTKRV
ncbi:COX assembly mitochondrial protein homolog [Eumeta japonica]|uniref:COX assembly mitochondrial protein n=1 Tax=Eumeta variegata TaxID=151549 RepID=A0A4C1TS71_EUMVA|nr:COX assembly mitochondrial protein homolog [Eumeta japonica]